MSAGAEGGLAFGLGNMWLLLATALVFIMHLGFACLEVGLTQAKNTVNILFKNTFVVCMGLLTYAAIGFALMYPGSFDLIPGWLGFAGFGLNLPADGLSAAYNPHYTYWTDFLFQAMFAATAATIVSGAVAERIRLDAFMALSVVLVAGIYPVVGSWKWGGGWLDALGFHDFAGATLVHGVGGWAALVAVAMLGPRLGKYTSKGIVPIPGSNMPLAAIGAFLLWFGWLGFNGGSVLAADPGLISHVLVVTCLGAAAGGMATMVASWRLSRKPDLSMTLNGILAGLVAVTAGTDVFSPLDGILAALCGGVLVVVAVVLLDRAGLDDPVGALSVHWVCGMWGTLAVGLFGEKAGLGQLGIQAVGIVACGIAASGGTWLVLMLLKRSVGIRVSALEEREGLDLGEHGTFAYALSSPVGLGPFGSRKSH